MRALSIGLALAVGCFVVADDKEKKDKAPKKPPVPTAIGPLEVKVPGEWIKRQPKRQFRILEWGVPTTEGDDKAPVCYVSELGGGGGGAEANLRRWEGEYDEKDGEPKRDKFESNGVKITVVDVTGAFKESMGGGPFAPGKVELRKGYRTLAAWVEPEGGDRVFSIKMVGPKKSVGAQRDDFIAMMKSATVKK
jgi:hypothetical protein